MYKHANCVSMPFKEARLLKTSVVQRAEEIKMKIYLKGFLCSLDFIINI